MSQTEPHQPSTAGDAIHPADVLLNLIVIILAPIFLDASRGNIAFARMAALETINAYRARNNADLIAIAQIIAFGLAALGSLSLSMADDISLGMTLRLRGNANALNRSAEQNRRALLRIQCNDAPPHQAEPSDTDYEAEVTAKVAALQQSTATPPPAPSPPPVCSPPPAPVPPVPTPPVPTPSVPTPPAPTEQERQAMWAKAMANVAAEVTASLPNLPPAERRAASIRAAALSSTASDLLSGNVPPRPRPGALDGMTPPRAA